ncbi:MAG: M20 family metallopeptidase [Peptostreptococcaceae bacterium]|nr:M20 family metallopeptidase [Peptostreptococcaceae bacterium]
MEITKFINEDEIIEIAKDLIAIEGHKDAKDKESKVVQYIQNLLEKENISVEIKEITEKRANIYGKIEGDNKATHLMFNGHTDTVPGFTMNYEPFKPFIKSGKIYGRGSADMKGGIAAMLAAMLAVKREGLNLNRTVMFAGVIDEEECSKGTEQMIKDKVSSKYVVIGEPTSLRVCIAHKGMEWIEVRFKGKATHGSRPQEGINAIYMASEFCKFIYNELETKIQKKEFELLGSGSINVGRIMGGDDPNIVPDTCIVQIDRRWLPNETLEGIHKEIEEYANLAAQRFGGTYSINAMRDSTASMINKPFSISANDELVRNSLEIVAEVIKQELPPRDFPGWSDAGLLSNHTDAKCIIIGPGHINQAHANDEFCFTDEIIKASEIYYKLIINMCK